MIGDHNLTHLDNNQSFRTLQLGIDCSRGSWRGSGLAAPTSQLKSERTQHGPQSRKRNDLNVAPHAPWVALACGAVAITKRT